MLRLRNREKIARPIKRQIAPVKDPDFVTIEPTTVAMVDVGISIVLINAKFKEKCFCPKKDSVTAEEIEGEKP